MAWAKLGTDTLSGAATDQTITVTSTTFNQILHHRLGTTLTHLKLRLGNGSVDTGNNYALRSSANGGADSTVTSTDRINQVRMNNTNHFIIGYVINIATEEKLSIVFSTNQNAAGAASAPERIEQVGKWANTSNQTDRFNINASTNELATDSNLIALGTD